jgi:ribosomal protein L20
MFTISYAIKPDVRDSYLEHARRMKEHFTTVGKKNYSVFETRGKKNHFTEVFITKLDEFIDDNGMKYSTLLEAL